MRAAKKAGRPLKFHDLDRTACMMFGAGESDEDVAFVMGQTLDFIQIIRERWLADQEDKPIMPSTFDVE